MITEHILAEAVTKGLVSPGQAEALRSLARQKAEPADAGAEPLDEEKLRFVSGFADIFVAIGVVLFLGASTYLVRGAGPPVQAAICAGLAWALAEFFTRRKRMALPSILLLCSFVAASFVGLAHLFADWAGIVPARPSVPSFWSWTGLGRGGPLPTAAACLGAAASAALHYWRFRVPITVAAGVAALAATALSLIYAGAPEIAARYTGTLVFATGLLVFAIAMRFDGSDPKRLTRRTDIAFWLHLLAAPMLVHSLFRVLGIAGRGSLDPGAAVSILLVFLLLGSVAILVDRRALLVSALAYAGWAFGWLIRGAGITSDATLPVTLLALGAFVLLLSAGWTPLRRLVLDRLPDGFASRLPQPLPI